MSNHGQPDEKLTASKILIVEDNELMRESLVIGLESAGYSVSQAVDGRSALRMIAQHSPAVVITDVLMPECDGLEVLQSLRGRNARPKIIAISGGGILKGETCLSLAHAFGADAVLAKPFHSWQLVATIEGLIAA